MYPKAHDASHDRDANLRAGNGNSFGQLAHIALDFSSPKTHAFNNLAIKDR